VLLFLGVLTLLVIVGVVLLLKQDGIDAPIPESDRASPQPARIQPAREGATREAGLRELVAPADPIEEEAVDMPASYRRALGILKGRVVEENGTPVADLAVEIFSIGAQELMRDASFIMEDDTSILKFQSAGTRTDEDGVFVLSDLYPRSFHLLGIDLEGPRSTSRFLDTVPGPGETKDVGDIVLAARAVLLGRVVDDEGAPVPNVRVRTTQLPPIVFISGLQDFREGCSFLINFGEGMQVIDPPAAVLQLYRMLPFPKTHTDEEGNFRLEGVPLGLLTVVADRPGYMTAQKSTSTAKGGEKDIGEIYIAPGVPLEGKVMEGEKEPVAHAEVRVGCVYGTNDFILLQAPIQSDENGTFFMPGVYPKSTYAAARRYPEDPWTVTGPFNPEQAPPVITLPPTYDLRVTVVDEERAAVENARLKVRSGEMGIRDMAMFNPPRAPITRLTRTEEGVLEVKDLPPGKYEILVSAPGYGVTLEKVNILQGGVEKEVTLKRGHEVTVQVLTEKEKKPVEWARITAAFDEDDWFIYPNRVFTARTDGQGVAVLENLSPETYMVHVSHPRYALSAAELKVPDTEELVVTLKPGGAVEGIVHRGGSLDEAPFMICLTMDEGVGGPEAETPRFTTTDLDGEFKVTDLNPGIWEVSVLKRLLDQEPMGLTEVLRRGPLMHAETEVWSEETSYIELNLDSEDLGPKGKITGRVRIDGKPAHGALLNLRAKGKRIEATVDASGDYRMDRVPVGEHTLRFSTLPAPLGLYDISLKRKIKVLENDTAFEDFEILTGRLFGRVARESDNGPVHGAQITAWLEKEEDAPYAVRVETLTDLDGKFLFESLPMGTYTVQVDRHALACQPVEGVKVFPSGAAGPINLVMIEPVWVKGRVELDEAMRSSRWLGLIAKPADDRNTGWEWIKVDRDTGQFKTSQLVPETYTVKLVGNLDRQYKDMEIQVPPGGVTNLVLVPEKFDEAVKRLD
jgi:protocatechuate 3,4-dioxygenase beta subunit